MLTRFTATLLSTLFACTVIACDSESNAPIVSVTDGSVDLLPPAQPDGGAETRKPTAYLLVKSTVPTARATDVALDTDIRIVFSAPLHLDIPAGAVQVLDAKGVAAAGRVLIDGATLLFVPARYKANTTYTVRLTPAVSGPDHALAAPFEFTFTTGTTNADLTPAPNEDFSPLGPGKQVLGRMPEYALFWGNDARTTVGVEDPGYMPAPLANLAPKTTGLRDLKSLGTTKVPLAAQVDDDGWDEVVVLSCKPGEARVLSILDTTAANTFADIALPFPLPQATGYHLAAGDVDGDGRDEVLVATVGASDAINYQLIDYLPDTKAYAVAATGIVNRSDKGAPEYVKLAAGDVDADGKAEMVVLWQAQSVASYVMLKRSQTGLVEMFPQRTVKQLSVSGTCHNPFVEVAVGDTNGDGKAEIHFAATEYIYEDYKCNLDTGLRYWSRCRMEDTVLVGAIDPKSPVPPVLTIADAPQVMGRFWSEDRFLNRARHHLGVFHAADLDGDLRDEIVVHDRVLKWNKTTGKYAATKITGIEMCAGKWDGCVPAEFGPDGATRDSGVGDMDGDTHEDLVLLRRNPAGAPELFHVDYATGTTLPAFDAHTLAPQQATTYATYAGELRLALPNVDDDSMIVEKIAHEVRLGDNVLTAVLAAPPCSAELGQNPEACSTGLDFGTTTSHSKGGYVNVSAGIIASLECEPKISIPFLEIKLTKMELNASVGIEAGYQYSKGISRSEVIRYNAGGSNHLVVFEVYVYDRFTYRVLSHPDAASIGKRFSLDVPTGYRKMAASQAYYNANNASGVDIDTAVLAARPGDITSYPSRGEAVRLMSGSGNTPVAISKTAIPVAAGTGNATSIELGISEFGSEEYSVGTYASMSFSLCAPSVSGSITACAGLEASLAGGFSSTHEWSKDLVFSGTVGGMDEEQYAAAGFDVGLFAYRATRTGAKGETQEFLVVNYYVD